jgi:hypothetical protein
MAAGDLTTLANVKAWLGAGVQPLPTTDDALLARLVTAASSFVQNWLGRQIASQAYAETMDGNGDTAMLLRQWPVTSVASLTIDTITIPASSPAPSGNGYLLQPWDGMSEAGPQQLALVGYAFHRRRQNVAVAYTAGYLAQGEPQAIPSGTPFQLPVTALSRPWNGDRGISFAGGAALVFVSSGSLAQGQYGITTTGTPSYVFNAADAGKPIAVTYSYTPFDIEQACIELVALRYKERSRIGEVSKDTGQSMRLSYSQKDMSDWTREQLMVYRRVAPQ